MACFFEISSDERFASSLRYLRRRVGGELFDTHPRARLVIKNAAMRDVVDAIADIIITDFKTHYIGGRIRLPIGDLVARHAFIRALSTFDRETDKIIAKTLITVTPNFHLDSFYEFMLDILKTRWNEVCILANENICYLVCQKTFLELLRFLISNIESMSEEAHIMASGEDFQILGSGLKAIDDIYINESLPGDVRTIVKLVSIAPKKIFLHGPAASFDKKMVTSIQNFFGTCVFVR